MELENMNFPTPTPNTSVPNTVQSPDTAVTLDSILDEIELVNPKKSTAPEHLGEIFNLSRVSIGEETEVDDGVVVTPTAWTVAELPEAIFLYNLEAYSKALVAKKALNAGITIRVSFAKVPTRKDKDHISVRLIPSIDR